MSLAHAFAPIAAHAAAIGDAFVPHVRKLTADEFQQMGQSGIFAANERVELIDGEICEMPPIGFEHTSATIYFNQLLSAAVAGRALVSVQNPLRLSNGSEVYPDLCLLKPSTQYRNRLPAPEDVLLVIEVAHSSFAYDKGVKAPLYARHGITELWLLDVDKRRLLSFSQPADGDYFLVKPLTGMVAPIALPDCVIDSDALFADAK